MSGGGQKSPQGYQPAQQAQADAGFMSGANQLSSAGSNLYGSVAPTSQTLASNVVNNPTFAPAMAGTQNTANVANTQVAPSQLNSGANIAALSPLAQSYIGATTIPELQAAGQVLQTGFDPQSALYNRTNQQVLDQQNAINAMNGVAGSPYAAGVTGQAMQNFNIDWQNQQLARQLQALSGASSAAGGVAGNVSGLIGAAGGAAQTGANLQNQGLNTAYQGAMAPYDLYTANQYAGLGALGQQVQNTVGSLAPTQQAIGDYGSYLNIGQGATRNAQEAVHENNAQQNAMWGGIGNLFGDITGMFAPIKL